jgi:hypothetical protein
MNHHADKPDPADPDATLAFYACPRCGTGGDDSEPPISRPPPQ